MRKEISPVLARRLAKLPLRFQGRLTEKKRLCITKYSTDTKLSAVLRWPERMVRVGLTGKMVAEKLGKDHVRISEYINLKIEPPEEVFLQIEGIIYKAEERLRRQKSA